MGYMGIYGDIRDIRESSCVWIYGDIRGYTGIHGIYANQAMCGYTDIYEDTQTGHTGIYGDIRDIRVCYVWMYGDIYTERTYRDIRGYTGIWSGHTGIYGDAMRYTGYKEVHGKHTLGEKYEKKL